MIGRSWLLLAALVGCEGGLQGPADAGKPSSCPESCPENFRCGSSKQCVRYRPSYRLTIDEASLPAVRGDGTPWDDGPLADAAPDPVVSIVRSSGADFGSTTPELNTTEPRWSNVTATAVTTEALLMMRLEVYDYDVVDDSYEPESVFGCDVAISLVPAKPFECSAGLGRVHGTVQGD